MSRDNQLQQAVLAELSWEPSVDAAHIGVAVTDGIVTLAGHVDSFAEKQAAENAAHRVKGVKGVVDEIEVRLPFGTTRRDDVIAAAVLERLAWDVAVPRDAITVTVENGWVTLSGEVDWHYQKTAAEQAVHRLYGVVGISNHTTINPKVDVTNISDEITHALHRSWFFDPKLVNVTAEGGRVWLSGMVHSTHERQLAAATAWAAPGVTDVVNEINVEPPA